MREPEGLTVAETCERLRLSRSTVMRLLRGGTLATFRHPSLRKVIVSEESVKSFEEAWHEDTGVKR